MRFPTFLQVSPIYSTVSVVCCWPCDEAEYPAKVEVSCWLLPVCWCFPTKGNRKTLQERTKDRRKGKEKEEKQNKREAGLLRLTLSVSDTRNFFSFSRASQWRIVFLSRFNCHANPSGYLQQNLRLQFEACCNSSKQGKNGNKTKVSRLLMTWHD